MRDIPSTALETLSQRMGVEPVNIIEVFWATGSMLYADREIGSIPGKILSLSPLDNVIGVSNNIDSQQISVVLDDTDGTIKAILDENDVHQRDVRVYQHFHGVPVNDKFLLFRGKISSPIRWSEGDRTVSFDVLSQIEDNEIGFSPEEGEFDEIPEDLVGRAWPMVFGTAVNVEAVPLTEPHTGTLGAGFSIIDFLLPHRWFAYTEILAYINEQISDWLDANDFSSVSEAADSADEEIKKELEGFLANKAKITAERADVLNLIVDQGRSIVADMRVSDGANAVEVTAQFDSFRVFGGEDFPRGTLTLDINGTLVTGQFLGVTDEFRVSSVTHPNAGESYVVPYAVGTTIDDGTFGFPRFIPNGQVGGDSAGYFFADAGSLVKISTAEPQRYVVSITPGEVLSVKAYVLANGRRFLMDVPQDLYSVATEEYGPISATIVTLTDALSKRTDVAWEDQIYVTFRSTIGPNTVDVLEYLVETHTDFAIDSTTFNHVRTLIDKYPSHFALTERMQVLRALQEIAFQARCAILLKDNTFYLRYLPEEPTPEDTISESDIEAGTFELYHTGTEELVTKLVARWRATGSQDKDNKVILRHNVKKYGTKEREINFYIYNHVDLVIKSATFWLIRWANTWKKVRFSTPLHKLRLENFDAITLSLNQPFVSSGDTLAILERAEYNSETQRIDFDAWTPIKAGTMTPYEFAHPATVDQTLVFPTPEEVEHEFDGGSGIGRTATGSLPERNSTRRGVRVEYDGPSDPFGFEAARRRYSDRGATKPSDVGDLDPGQPLVATALSFESRTRGAATPTFEDTRFYTRQEPAVIDIAKTKIIDSRDPEGSGNNLTTFSTFFAEISEGKLKMATDATLVDANDRTIQAVFDFAYDEDGEKWGAGTAFLQE